MAAGIKGTLTKMWRSPRGGPSGGGKAADVAATFEALRGVVASGGPADDVRATLAGLDKATRQAVLAQRDDGWTLFHSACQLGRLQLAYVLLEMGADVNATANMYGGSSTALGLLVTSNHPARAGVTGEVRQVLLDAGAKQD